MIRDKFEQQVKKNPDKPAVKTETGALTYSQLDAAANRIANAIKQTICRSVSESPVRIGLLHDDALTMIASILGVLKSGNIYVPLSLAFPVKRINYILNHAEIDGLITAYPYKEMVNQAAEGRPITVIFTEDTESQSAVITEETTGSRLLASDSDAYILYTSGSTGFPKGVRQTHRNVVYFIERYIENLRLTRDDNLTLFSSFVHDASIVDIYAALFSGATLFPVDLKKDGIFTELVQWLNDEHITVWHSVPTVYRYFISELTNQRKDSDFADRLRTLRTLVLGGESVLKSDVEKFYAHFPSHCTLYNLYGQTESSYNSGQSFSLNTRQENGEISITLGEPVRGTQLFVVDDEGNETDELEVGEILVMSDHLSPGYWNDDPNTNEKFSSDPENGRVYFTGDRGRRLPNGEIEYIGRKDNQVKLRGYRIELGEIENAVMQFPLISHVAVVALETSQQEKFIACYFSAPLNIDFQALRRFLGERLLDYMVPSYFKQMSKLPVTVSGKIDRKALPAPDITSGADYLPPRNELESKLVAIWCHILDIGKEVVGIDSNFFQLGGHSLSATALTSKIHMELNARVPLSEVFQRQTIRQLAEYIEQSDKSHFERIEPAEKREYYPLSSTQKQMYFIQQLDIDSPTYNIPFLILFGEYMNLEQLSKTFLKIIDRHEILRTSFEMIDQEPVQRIHDVGTVGFNLGYVEVTPEEKEHVQRQFLTAFDLTQPPLIRALAMKVGNQYILMVDHHHIIVDYLSLNLLEADFFALYDEKEMPELPIYYKDYIVWQNTDRRKAVLETQGEYWKKMFADELPVLELPVDFPRPATKRFKGKSIGVIYDIENTRLLKRFAERHDVTLFMVLFSSYTILFSWLSGQEDIVVGTPWTARKHAMLFNTVGMFVNTLPLRNRVIAEKRYIDMLHEVKHTVLEAFENQEYPFTELVSELRVPRNPGRNPMFDVVFNFIDERVYKFETSEVGERDAFHNLLPAAPFDISLTAVDRGDTLYFRFEYSTDLFKETTMERFIGYFKRIFEIIRENPELRICDMGMMTDEEKAHILYNFNQTAEDSPANKTIPEWFEEQVQRGGDRIALVHGYGQGTCHFSYTEFNLWSDQLAAELKNKGVEPDTIVGIRMERSIEMIVGLMGILKSGGAYLPIDPSYPKERIDYMLGDSGAKLMITDECCIQFRRGAPMCAPDAISRQYELGQTHGSAPTQISAFMDAPAGHRPLATSLAYIIYTSGSTGKPKGVLTMHSNVTRVVKHTNYIDVVPADRVLQLSNYAFDGSVFDIYGALLNGASLVVIDRETVSAVDRLAQEICREQVTVFFVTTALFNAMVDLELGSLKYIRKVLFGGEKVSVAHCRKALDYLGKGKLIHVYGPTESTVYATYDSIDSIDQQAVTVPIGRPLSQTAIYILDNYMNPVPIGVSGEIFIGGEGIARGYLNNPELTFEKFRTKSFWSHLFSKRWAAGGNLYSLYKTGDLARWREDGAIEFMGRTDRQVKLRGFRIELEEVQHLLNRHPEINQAVVVLRDDPSEENGAYLCAYLVARTHVSEDELRGYVSMHLPAYMVPSFFVSVDHIPLTSNGKIDVKALPLPGFRAGLGELVAPRDEIEMAVAQIWADILRMDQGRISIDDDFFKLGGHSLNAITAIARMNKVMGMELGVGELFRTPTVRQIASLIKDIRYLTGGDPESGHSCSGQIGDDIIL
ncbi:MAG: amino acid adenylation domain-containing protein [Candidatus Omnitrophota bacterium]